MAPLVYWLIAIYSTSFVDCDIVCCRLLFHETTPSPTNKTYPDVDLQFFTLPVLWAQSYGPHVVLPLPVIFMTIEVYINKNET